MAGAPDSSGARVPILAHGPTDRRDRVYPLSSITSDSGGDETRRSMSGPDYDST
jgi:hypothetical protein